MKISVVTPTNNVGPFLGELYDSLTSQTYDNWGWLVYLNGEAKLSDLPEAIVKDTRVTAIDTGEKFSSIGRIKHNAFMLADGDILAEVDHDDLLHEECLEKVAKAFEDPEIGFVYTDTLIYDQCNEKKTFYNPTHGWNSDWLEFRGDKYFAPKSFEPTSRSLSYIWYAPDHIRAWRASTYKELGGHNPEYEVCDDHELLIRTYLHTKMLHIPETLYYYRIHGNPESKDNTFIKRNAKIQELTKSLFLQYARKLAEHDCNINDKMKIDLGGGLFPLSGYTTIDQQDADIICDLDEGIPLPDNSVGIINASHIIEHLRDPVKTMSEIHRVLCDGGWAFIEVPSTDGRGAWQDPTHVSFWNENSFWYYTKQDQAQYIRNKDIRFQSFRLETYFPSEWYKQGNIPVVRAILCAVKSDERRPHTLEI